MFKLQSTARLSNILTNYPSNSVKAFMNLTSIKFNFAKQVKENKKPAGKQQPKQQVIEDPSEKLTPIQRYTLLFQAATPTISPSQRQAINNKFDDLSDSDKELLDILAGKILDTNTTIFYDFAFKKGGLGTSQGLYAASSNLTQEQINHSISVLRKDI